MIWCSTCSLHWTPAIIYSVHLTFRAPHWRSRPPLNHRLISWLCDQLKIGRSLSLRLFSRWDAALPPLLHLLVCNIICEPKLNIRFYFKVSHLHHSFSSVSFQHFWVSEGRSDSFVWLWLMEAQRTNDKSNHLWTREQINGQKRRRRILKSSAPDHKSSLGNESLLIKLSPRGGIMSTCMPREGQLANESILGLAEDEKFFLPIQGAFTRTRRMHWPSLEYFLRWRF